MLFATRISLIAAVLAGILGLVACERLPLPSDAEKFSPPAVYSTWWNMTEACSAHTGSLDAVTWFKTDQVLHDPRTGDPIVGYWSSSTNRIVLTTIVMLDGGSVRHEMLHALLRKPGHQRDQFLGKCAGTVRCQEGCIEDAGPYPQPGETPIHVTGDSIDISVAIGPRNPTSTRDAGFFSITVLVRNRSAHWATVPPYFPGTDSSTTFQFNVQGRSGGISGGEIRLDPSQWIFAPGEIKKQVFDFAIGNDPFSHKLPPGSYTVRGGYSDYWSTDSTIVIGR